MSNCETDELKTNEYLDLCRFLMRESSPECNGMLLRGSSMIEDKALQLLRSYNFNFELASFHILNAE